MIGAAPQGLVQRAEAGDARDMFVRPLSEEEVALLARSALALDLPEECRAGVAANLAALAEHARRVAGDDAG